MKDMRKLLSTVLVLSLALAGCGKDLPSETKSDEPQSVVPSNSEVVSPSDSTPAEEDIVISRVEFSGLDEVTVNKGDALNPKEGVRVTAFYEGGSIVITSYVTVKQGDKTLSTACDTQEEGDFTLTYSINTDAIEGFSFAGVEGLTQTRTLHVEAVSVSSEELIKNGDFSEGGAHWGTYSDGSNVQYKFDQGYMECIETTVSGNSYSPRLNTTYPNTGDEFTLVYGTTYLWQAELWATANKTIQVQLGTILPGAPYWEALEDTDGNANLLKVFNITTEKKLYTWQFTLASNTKDNVHMTLEMGTVNGDATVATVYADNISLKAAVDDGVDRVPPSITGNDALRIDVTETAGTVDVMQGIAATDNKDGDITSKVVAVIKKDGAEVQSIPTNEEGIYEVTYTVADEAGNEKTVTRTIKVVAVSSAGTNFANPTALITDGDEAAMKANPTKNLLYYWRVADAGWNCGPVITATTSYESGTLRIEESGLAANENFWSSQLFYQTEELAAGEYIVSLMVYSDVERKIRINNVDYQLEDGVNRITYLDTLAAPGCYELAIMLGGGELFSGNTTTFEFSEFLVTEAVGQPTGLILDGEEPMKANPTKNLLYYWHVADAGWGCGPVITTTTSFENGVFKLDESGLAANENVWSSQLFYQTDELAAGTYVVMMDIKSDVARKVTINGVDYELVAGENHITIGATLEAAGNIELACMLGGGALYAGDASSFEFSNIRVYKPAPTAAR